MLDPLYTWLKSKTLKASSHTHEAKCAADLVCILRVRTLMVTIFQSKSLNIFVYSTYIEHWTLKYTYGNCQKPCYLLDMLSPQFLC